MNRENLQKLADGLRGPLAIEFDMVSFFEKDTLRIGITAEKKIQVVPISCGTCACAVGHATYLVGQKNIGEDFTDYSKRLFGVDPEEVNGEWDWCFSSLWEERDNTPEGCADRIERMLKNGVPSEDEVEGMLHSDDPLCYRTLK